MEGMGERKVRFGANLKRLLNATLRHECIILHEKYDGECANIAEEICVSVQADCCFCRYSQVLEVACLDFCLLS